MRDYVWHFSAPRSGEWCYAAWLRTVGLCGIKSSAACMRTTRALRLRRAPDMTSFSAMRAPMSFFQAEDGIRDSEVTGVQTCLFRSTTLFFFQAEDGIRDSEVTGVQTCALPI